MLSDLDVTPSRGHDEPIPSLPQPTGLPSVLGSKDSASFEAPWASNDEAEKDDEFCSVGLQEFPVFIDPELTLTLLQAPTAFSGVQHDQTGTVVWGASVCLARYLSPQLVRHKTVLELGSGCGLPSLVAAHHRGARRVVASDMEDSTLQQLDQVARLNGLQDALELVKLNWNEHQDTVEQADVVLASDVIYHEEMVAPLVQTIDQYLAKGGKAYLALRTTRQGVSTFWQEAMPAAGFELVDTVSCEAYLKKSDSEGHRFRGDHSIFVFQRK